HELPLSPGHTETTRHRSEMLEPEQDAAGSDNTEQGSFEPGWRSSPRQSEYFEKMWPAAERTPAPPKEEGPSWSESVPRAPAARAAEPAVEPPHEEDEPVAILKSGVVDGMGYTLYVDGSIEAELPDGTLRFASINELRKHLEEKSGT